eukprot:12207565-Alexandrium_andersonii.AAC.1
MSGVASGSTTQVQRGKRKDYYGMDGLCRGIDPAQFGTYIFNKMTWQHERLLEMNPDPAGQGIVNQMQP